MLKKCLNVILSTFKTKTDSYFFLSSLSTIKRFHVFLMKFIAPATPATTTPNESLQLIGGFHLPSTTLNDPQPVPMTRWGLSMASKPLER